MRLFSISGLSILDIILLHNQKKNGTVCTILRLSVKKFSYRGDQIGWVSSSLVVHVMDEVMMR